MTTPKWQSPRRLSLPTPKAPSVSREMEKKRRDVLRRSGMQSDRSRGWKRGGGR